MTELFTDTVLNMMTTTAEPEDYTGEDGLLYCGKCRTAKEAYFPKETAAWLGHDKHPTECDCQREKRLECESAEERRRHLDTFYLTRVVDNLLHNAAKFTAAGRITLRCRNDESRRTLQISVSDTGIGIPPEKQEWVFERFTKVDPFKPGSGIGLYLCRLIVTRLGGDIRVCPEYSGGCCIRIELPY